MNLDHRIHSRDSRASRRLGASGPAVFPLGLGCMGMSEDRAAGAGERYPAPLMTHLDSER